MKVVSHQTSLSSLVDHHVPEKEPLIKRDTSNLTEVTDDSSCSSSSDEDEEEASSTQENHGGLFQSIFGLEPLQFLCSCSWIMSSKVVPQGTKLATAAAPRQKPRTTVDMAKVIKYTKYTYSLALLGVCVNVIIAGIFADQTPVAISFHPLVAFATMWILILWLGVLEGGQGSLVGLQPIDKTAYAETHPIAHRCTTLAHEGDNINRFIVGRQFLVVLVVFCLNLCCTVVENAIVPGFPKAVIEVVLESGLAVMLITVILGQLSAEVNATNCMLDFINSHVVYVTTWFCLAIETSGLLHSVYLVQEVFALCTGKSATKLETQRTRSESFFYWLRVISSFGFVSYAMAVTLSALLNNQTTMYEGLPDLASVAVFFFLICFLGMLEAMQIALFAVVNLPESALEGHAIAKANCQLAFRGNNFQAFLIGRQIFVTMCMFLLARITTTEVNVEAGEATVLNMSNGLQDFFNTGLPGALITTILASLVWRIVASCFPVVFMGNPLVYVTIQMCLLLEATGVFSASWLLADVLKRVVGLRNDEEYVGSMGQREGKHGHGGVSQIDEEAGLAGYGATTH